MTMIFKRLATDMGQGRAGKRRECERRNALHFSRLAHFCRPQLHALASRFNNPMLSSLTQTLKPTLRSLLAARSRFGARREAFRSLSFEINGVCVCSSPFQALFRYTNDSFSRSLCRKRCDPPLYFALERTIKWYVSPFPLFLPHLFRLCVFPGDDRRRPGLSRQHGDEAQR